jgi:ABC-type oligopeptide transport system ATPase subunit
MTVHLMRPDYVHNHNVFRLFISFDLDAVYGGLRRVFVPCRYRVVRVAAAAEFSDHPVHGVERAHPQGKAAPVL